MNCALSNVPMSMCLCVSYELKAAVMREGDDGAIHSDFIYTSELLMMIMKGKKQTQTE